MKNRKSRLTKLSSPSKANKSKKDKKRTGGPRLKRTPRRKIAQKVRSSKREILVQRSSGRQERFNTDRLAQTVSRSGVPYLMARDIAKKTTTKIKSYARSKPSKRKSRQGKAKPVLIQASRMRNLVAGELRERNRPDIASSYTGNSPEHIDLQTKPTLDEKEPILDNVAANRTKVLFDPSKQKGSA